MQIDPEQPLTTAGGELDHLQIWHDLPDLSEVAIFHTSDGVHQLEYTAEAVHAVDPSPFIPDY